MHRWFGRSAAIAGRGDAAGRRPLPGAALSAIVALAIASGCATVETPVAPTPPPEPDRHPVVTFPPVAAPASTGQLLAQNERYVIYVPTADDTLKSIARRFLGSDDLDWAIADFNRVNRALPGQPIVVPLQRGNTTGVFADGYQTVPILCYHRFGTVSGKMTLTPANFAAQLDYLARNDYRVIRLSDLVEFLEGKRSLPKRAVVITIDDGYVSAYHTAFPLLKRYGFPATVFVYSDFIGSRDALTWAQMQEMVASGLVDVQAHSKTHSNLTLRRSGESDERYRDRLDWEIRYPRQIVQQRLSVRVTHFAYPYGDTNEIVVQRLARADYKSAVTVNPGPNAFFSPAFALRRTMIFGDHDLEAFKAKLQVFREMDLR
ncbi:MAG TPA: polysaccharide deacetylase family protein [Burkholderiales bacterium]|nr:polysaccharide deacetylase family protein [Burkholderiales bacterium]